MIDDNFVYYFNSILSKGKKDNTYKFALARFLIDYAHGLEDSDLKTMPDGNVRHTIEFSTIAKAFLRYYWHQVCKYKIRQNCNIDKPPLIVQIIQSVFGSEYIPESFDSMNKEKVATTEKLITKKCFAEVVPRFQNITNGIRVTSNNIFYEYSDDVILVKLQAILFFKQNYSLLFKAVILEWARFLERINPGLPRLISKIEGDEPSRRSLERYKIILGEYFTKCFYCPNLLANDKRLIHVDHFIPWSYIFEDEIWNLVLTCRSCNLKKHSSLAPKHFLESLVNRNNQYCDTVVGLKKSLLRLDPDLDQEKAIRKHYQNCMDYGFTITQF